MIAANEEAAGRVAFNVVVILVPNVLESAWPESPGAAESPKIDISGLGVSIRKDVFRRASLGS